MSTKALCVICASLLLACAPDAPQTPSTASTHNTITSGTGVDAALDATEEKPATMIPPDVASGSFFSDALVDFSGASGWNLTVENGRVGAFRLSRDQAIRGAANLKVWVREPGRNARVVVMPPSPIRIDRAFDTLDLWLFTHTHGGFLTFRFTRPDGTTFRWAQDRTASAPYIQPGLHRHWKLAHVVLPERLNAGTTLDAIEIDLDWPVPTVTNPLPTTLFYYLDQLAVSLFDDTLARPRREFPNVGAVPHFPVSSNGARPKAADLVRGAIFKRGDTFVMSYAGRREGTVKFIYAPATGTLSDLTVKKDGYAFKPAMGSGPLFEFAGPVSASLLAARIDGNRVVATWRYSSAGGAERVETTFSLHGKTLQIDLRSDGTGVTGWEFGRAQNVTPDQKAIDVPFMEYSPKVLFHSGLFTSYLWDWYASNASTVAYGTGDSIPTPCDGTGCITGRNDVVYTYLTPLRYLLRTDGSRHPFNERLYISVSSVFDDVLPSISNPPSPHKATLAKRLYKMVSVTPAEMPFVEQSLDFLRKNRITNLFYMFHAGIWTGTGGGGPEPFTGRMHVARAYDAVGGDRAFIDLFGKMEAAGIHPGYYDGFPGLETIDSLWCADCVSLSTGAAIPGASYVRGAWLPSWYQNYAMKPWYFPELAATAQRERARVFRPRAGYQDGWTANIPFELNDYDHRYPESGKMIDTIRAMATGFQRTRENYDGPVFSEGGGRNHFLAGLVDGTYGLLPGFTRTGGPAEDREPLLVDFKLKRLGPLNASVGVNMGYHAYRTHLAPPVTGDFYDHLYQYLATQIAFGTMGMLEPYGWVEGNNDVTLKSYFLIQQLQERYLMEKVTEVKYFNGTRLIDTSEAIATDAYRRNKVFIRYANGLTIHVNGNWDGENWGVTVAGRAYVLPPGGWVARQGNDFLEYSALEDGRRVDVVRSPAYDYSGGDGAGAISVRFK